MLGLLGMSALAEAIRDLVRGLPTCRLVEMHVGGRALMTDGAVLSLPAGGRGSLLPDGAPAEAMDALPCWSRIGGITDGLLTDTDPANAARLVRPSLEDCLLSVWTR